MTFHLRKSFVILPLSLLLATAASADRYVAQAGQAQGTPYDSWANAASNIQTAVNAASAGETVWVSNGVYRTASSPVVSITKSLSLRSVVTNTEAVIDGEGATRRGIEILLDTPANVLIDGFTVTNCTRAAGSGTHFDRAGAGILIETTDGVACTVALQNCIIRNNTCSSTHSAGTGAGISVLGTGDDLYVILSHCAILGNYARSNGGGVYLNACGFRIEDCHIADNQVDIWDPFADPPVAASDGRGAGGIAANYCRAGSVIRDCTIENNRSSRWGGGILSRYDGELLIENCTIRSNVSPEGAGICIAGHSGDPTNIVRNCLIDRNWALTNNIAGSYGYGGGLLIGAVSLGAGNNVHVENCTVVSNKARIDGGGVRIYTTGGMTAWNSIFYNNWTTGDNDSNYYGTATWTNCLVGTGNVLPGSGNITDQNPAFIDFDGQDYHLTRTSPCVDNGYNLSSWMDAEARDLDGNYRVRPAGGDVDIGAYEYQPKGTLITIL